ncbi:MAG: hypothetical protein A2754_00585 [Candidatus Magasanikbacteria bacterium RIFCSPHIGHO2_01_FULL_47_8]|uniref:PD-(D/E)XK endonuclease-like domain-containing protein n=1 Tax=Candidatus Magasanikbacteria bacterium RIFCSPHIGHO2_01_FULL_47_8 TaxID=1798673 RepID=A0A1F6MCH1_9BACT|nr:MAG: hypothetical protein A2754_00585 [Candidatus Magasanikbacteria bacterium RIFCSPHIGHO2_01_FULL_47_8]
MDKYTATWASHTTINDFLRCPRAYYLKAMYKDPKTNHKIKLMSPALALGQAVHEVLESLSVLPKQSRFSESLIAKFEKVWEKVKGKKGGFLSDDVEYKYKMRGQEMLRRVMNNPGPISGLAVKIQMDLPYFWISEEDNIILCGKIDWLEYLPESDSVHIIDFKTGKSEEDPGSLQLPIYLLLVNECQKRQVSKASYWYLDSSDTLTTKELPDLETARKKVLEIARQMKVARQIMRFKCQGGEEGCFTCRPMEAIVNHEAEFVGVDEYNYDVYILNKETSENRDGLIL